MAYRAQITVCDERANPVSTPEGFATRPVPWRFLTQFPSVLYNTNNAEEFARVAHAGEEAMVPAGVQNPVLAAYSATAANKNALLQSDFLSAVIDIVSGRRPVEDLTQAVSDWRTKGGDTMRAEYEQALAANKT